MEGRFFGYGSLVNADTHRHENFAPAQISGWRRRWSHRVQRNGFQVSSLTVFEDKGTVIAGATATVKGQSWEELDAREHGYERLILADDALSTKAKNVSMYKSLAQNDQLGTAEFPILQSYLDCVLQGFLRVHGPAAPEAFIATTDGWSTPILQDRLSPLYPRAISLSESEVSMFDALLSDMPKI